VGINRINARHGTFVKERITGTNIYLLGLPPGADLVRVLSQMRSNADLLFAEPNYDLQLPEVRQTSHAFIDQTSHAFIDGQSPVSFYGQQPLANLNLDEAHNFSRGLGVKVAVIDTGLDFTHSLFGSRIGLPVYDFVDNDGMPNDEPNGTGSGHGTFIAGLIRLTAPDAMIMPLRAFGPDGRGTSFNIAKAIRYAADNGANVINMSFGLLEQDKMIRSALDYAYSRAYMVASVGNESQEIIHFPADVISRTLSVTSTTANDIKAPFANYHNDIYASAPGVLLYSAYPGGRWAWWSGTSFSTALVTGESAILLGLNPSLNFGDLSRIITNSGVNIDPLNPAYKRKLGRRIDYLAAVNILRTGQ
jgi:subtilisin family serine protease